MLGQESSMVEFQFESQIESKFGSQLLRRKSSWVSHHVLVSGPK